MSPRLPRGSRLLGGVAALALLGACPQQPGGTGSTPRPDVTSEDYVMPPLPHAFVRLHDAYGGVHRVDVEVAATPDARTRGLMWRKSLPAGTGMLFIFAEESVQSFWMRNTLIPLDMLFINSGAKLVGIIENAEPRTLTGRSVGVPSQYVLEVPGGWTQSVGVTTGTTVEFEGLEGIQVVP